MVILNVSENHQWEVCIRKIGPDYCIADGWIKFIENIRLNPGDILCFQKKDMSHINIIIFNKDGRQVLLNNTPFIELEYEHISNVEGYRQVSDDPNYPFFAMTVTHQLILHKLITDLNGLNEFSEVKIKVFKGNTWVKNLCTHNIDGQRRYDVVGWHDILQAEHIT
ncbi:putative transcription factor B3-Domain family [Helianthus anomalus]